LQIELSGPQLSPMNISYRSKQIFILFPEGSSLSARQALSALGPLGYRIDVCDANPLCVSRFSRFVRRFYRCPAFGADPMAYLESVGNRLDQGRYDVLLPVHEQTFLFARIQSALARKVGVALTPFDRFARLQSKAEFTRVLVQLSLPQPTTRLVRCRAEIESEDSFPYYVKLPYSTAGRGVPCWDWPPMALHAVASLARPFKLFSVEDAMPGATKT
jgi:hypothetical protein